MTTVGIIGAGKVGSIIGRLATNAGYQVLISEVSDDPMKRLVVETLIPGASLVSEAELVERADFTVLALPMSALLSVDFEQFSGKIVVDVTNYWYPVDGHIDAVENRPASTSELVAALNPQMRLVKTLNHLGYHDMETDARPAGSPDRRAVAVASDDAEAADLVAEFVDAIGFDPVTVPLAKGALLEADGPIFGVVHTRAQLEAALADA